MKRSFLTLAILMLSLRVARAETRKADIVVYGAGASGVIAAVAAAREGKSVLLIEPGKHVGGMVSGGLGATDFGKRGAIGGYSREFFTRVREHYIRKYGPTAVQVKECSDGFHFEPHVATLIFNEMLKEAKVEVLFGQRLDKVTKQGARIESFTTLKGDTFVASVFIDATYEGDLMAKAGVGYHVGREARSKYNESIAGVQARSPAHQWPLPVSGLSADGKLLPFIQNEKIADAGTGDKKVQAYNFRLCMTDRAENQVPFPKPANYDATRYELLARYLAKRPDVKVGQLMAPVRMPNGKTDTNNNGPFSTDHIGANWDYPEADYATRERIWQDHIDYTQGFLYFLANDPRVPEALQKDFRRWGLAKDEFTDTNNWPHQLYVREARRMIGAHVMTQADILDKRTQDDSVGLGSYNTDSHHVQRVVTEDGNALNEGDFQVGVQPYAIPYRSLTPKGAECENLFAPVCMSASHVAYCTVRMEPVYMILGHASGVAAAQAIDAKSSVQAINIDKLQARLKEQKSVLSPSEVPSTGVPAAARLDPAKLSGIVVDDPQTMKTGDWKHSASIGRFVGEGYLHDNDEDKGKKRIRFTPKLPAAGKYEVFLHYTPSSNRATNVSVTIKWSSGEEAVRVDQRKAPGMDGSVKLGSFTFDAGEKGYVEIGNTATDGHVIADAVRFVPLK